jgi:two-component system KDP operon response regulator KdpE
LVLGAKVVSAEREPPQILVVDDDEGVLRYVETILAGNGYRVRRASDGQAAISEAIEYSPDLVILDLSLPAVSGLDVCKQLRGWYQSPILVLSAHHEEQLMIKALDLGTNDYLTKPFRSGELLARIRALLRRSLKQPAGNSTLRVGNLKMDFAKRTVFRGDHEITLTRTEFDVLAYLARHLDRVVAPELILQQVWGRHHGEYEQTLRVHIGHIRKKIEPDPSKPRYVVTEPGVGYRLAVPAETRPRGPAKPPSESGLAPRAMIPTSIPTSKS